MLKDFIEAELKVRKISYRQAAQEIGISHTTVMQARRGRTMDTRTAVKICEWLNIPYATIFPENDEMDATIAMIAALLKTNPELKQALIEASQKAQEGKFSTRDFQEILEFIAFKTRNA